MSDAALAGVPGGPRGGVAEPLVTRPFNVLGTRFECPVRYTLIKPIGQGAYGIVWYVVSDGGAPRAIFYCVFIPACVVCCSSIRCSCHSFLLDSLGVPCRFGFVRLL